MTDDVAARLNNEAYQKMAQGGTAPVTGGTGAVAAVAGVNLVDTNGLVSNTEGVLGQNKHIAGLGSMFFSSKQGPSKFNQFLKDGHLKLSEMSAQMHEQLKQATANMNGMISGGSGAGGIEPPMSTPPVAANGNDKDTGTRIS